MHSDWHSGLCELCSGLEIEICGKGEFCEWNDTADGYRLYGGCDIVLSDRELSSCGLPEGHYVLKLQRKECFLPVPADSGGCWRIAYEQKTRKKFFAETGGLLGSRSFYADQGRRRGHCGQSDDGAAAGRHAGRSGLYLELVPPDALQGGET